MADVTAEMSWGREIKTICDVGQGQRTVAKKTGYLDRGVAVNPISSSGTADGLAGLGEIFGCDAQLVGIISNPRAAEGTTRR